jgi:hypothetical protein
MFTGALAASYYGVPRTTMDIDVVIEISEGSRGRLLSALRQAELQADAKKIEQALKSDYRKATFRDRKSPYSVDVIFSSKKLEKKPGTIAGLPTFYQTPEDLILAKLRMIKATVPRERALKDEGDVKPILRFTKVNVETVEKQARKSNTLPIFKSIIT